MQGNVKFVTLASAKRELEKLSKKVPTIVAAAETGIHQSQVSRLYRGLFTRMSPNVQTLLDYAKQPQRRSTTRAAEKAAKAAVIRAALRTWDATPEGAQALVRLLRSVEDIKRPRRRS